VTYRFFPLQGTGAGVRFRRSGIRLPVQFMSYDGDDRDAIPITVLRDRSAKYLPAKLVHHGRFIVDFLDDPNIPALIRSQPEPIDVEWPDGTCTIFEGFAVIERREPIAVGKPMRRILVIESTGNPVPLESTEAIPAPPRNSIWLSPDSPYLKRLAASYSMIGCSLTAMLKTSAPWDTAKEGWLVANTSLAAYSRVIAKFLYESGEWRLSLWTRASAEVETETKWTVPAALFDGEWHSFGFTHNDNDGTAAAFLDGVAMTKVAGATWDVTINGSGSLPLWVLTHANTGSDGVAARSLHNVRIGNLKVWDRDLIEEELLAELGWGEMADTYCSLCYLPFSEQTGGIAYDQDGEDPALDLDLAATDRWRCD